MAHRLTDPLHKLIGSIFATVENKDAWVDVAARIRSLLPWVSVTVTCFKKTSGGFVCVDACSSGLPQHVVDAYHNGCAGRNPWVEVCYNSPIGSIIIRRSHEKAGEIVATSFQTDFIAPNDIEHAADLVLHKEGPYVHRLACMWSSARGERCETEVRRLLEQLEPWLIQAAAKRLMVERMSGPRNTICRLIDDLNCPGFLLTLERRIEHANLKGEKALARATIVRRNRRGELELKDREADKRLAEALLELADLGAHPALGQYEFEIDLPTRPQRCRATLLPYSAQDAPSGHNRPLGNRRREQLFVLNYKVPPRPADPATRWAHFKFTETEMRIALELSSGRHPSQIAQGRKRAKDTVRTQLQKIFNKTGTHRQRELIDLLRRLLEDDDDED